MVLWGTQYYWKPKIVSQVDQKCQKCLQHNPRKPIHTFMEHFPLPLELFEVWQMDFIWLPPSQVYKPVLVICVFSLWVEAGPCHRTAVSAIDKILLEKIFPTWGNALRAP